jgi:hypothetical protein
MVQLGSFSARKREQEKNSRFSPRPPGRPRIMSGLGCVQTKVLAILRDGSVGLESMTEDASEAEEASTIASL